MFATRHPLLPLLSPPTPCCGNGPGCVVFSPAFLGLLFGLMVLEMLCKQLRLCFILSCCLWFISVSRTALQFDHVEYRAVLRVLRAFAAVVRRCWRSTCARQVALVVRAVYFPGSSVGYQRCRHVGVQLLSSLCRHLEKAIVNSTSKQNENKQNPYCEFGINIAIELLFLCLVLN